MRVITTSVTVYTFDELSDDAKEKAIESVREFLARAWDSSDTEQLAEAIVYTLAEKLGSPGWDTYGSGDFPGIDGVTMKGWDLDRGQSIDLDGAFTRDNAPALPWVDGIERVELNGRRLNVFLVDTEPDCTCPQDNWLVPHDAGCPSLTPVQVSDEARSKLEQAARDAVSAAWHGGRTELEWMESDEYVKDHIEANEYEFTEEGEQYW